jgi:hypothetical protein
MLCHHKDDIKEARMFVCRYYLYGDTVGPTLLIEMRKDLNSVREAALWA